MSVENLNHCSKLTYPIIKHDETNIELDDGSSNLAKWNTETQETFVSHKVEEKKIGNCLKIVLHIYSIF